MTLYRYVNLIAPGLSIPRRAALVSTARSLDITTSVDGSIRETKVELRSVPGPVNSRADVRRRVAESAADLEAKRERVAMIRGRLQETDDGSIESEYRAAIRTLSEAETEHAAAAEALEEARTRARAARDILDRRLRIEDRLENLERAARAELVATITPAVETALSNLPGRNVESFEDADSVSAALAIARVGRIERPITLACRRFSDRGSAERWLEVPVYRL